MAGAYNTTINMWVGDLEFVNTNDSMLSVDHSRIANAVSESLVIEAYDDTAVVLDEAVTQLEENELKLQYGYTDGYMSDMYEVTVTKYSTEFTGHGTLCTIEGTSTAVAESTGGSTADEAKTYHGTISEIVAQVAAEEGWSVGSIEATTFDEVEETKAAGQSSLEFIASLQKKAKSQREDAGNYNFFIKESDGQKIIYFTPSMEAKDFGESEDDSIDPYSYQFRIGMPNEKVISFTPEYQEALAALLGAGGVSASAQDSDSNDAMSVKVTSLVDRFFSENAKLPVALPGVSSNDKATRSDAVSGQIMPMAAVSGGGGANSGSGGNSGGQTSESSPDAAVDLGALSASDYMRFERRLGGNSYSYDTLVDKATALYGTAQSLVYTATLVIKGTPNIVPNSMINILVLTPQGMVHHSSGKYCVATVDDLIDGGVYTTTLSLMKNVDKIPEITVTNNQSSTAGAVNGMTAQGNTGVLGGDATTPEGAKIVAKAKESMSSPGGGLCAKWVADVYEWAGYPMPRLPGACDYYYKYCKSSNKADLKPGMMVATPSHPGTSAGQRYGHIAIYIGGGQVMDNIGYIRTTDLDGWISYYGKTNQVRWGWGL